MQSDWIHISFNPMKSGVYRFLNHYQGSYTKKILDEAIILLGDLWPYLLLGIVLTTVIKLFISKDWLARFLGNNKHLSIPFAALLGIVSPLGSYILIPLSAALYITGVPLSILMALLVSSPLINPNLFLLTQGALGIEIALARIVASFLLGLAAGYLTAWMENKGLLKFTIKPEAMEDHPFSLTNSKRAGWKRFGGELYRMTKYIGKFFFLAILLAAVIKIITPTNLMIRIFKGNNFLSVLLSTSAGIPFYVCGGAAIPVVKELADLGLSKGAVLAFFISGPVTKLSNLILMYTIFQKRLLLFYLAIGVFGAIILGICFNLL